MTFPLTEVALFAGVGGMMLGLHRAGWQTVAAAEIDPKCQQVLRQKFDVPIVPDDRWNSDGVVLGDVTELRGDRLRELYGPVTLLSYTWPCQGNSVAGKRAGLADPRSGLFHEAARIRDELQCPLSLGENVPGALSVNGGRDFAVVLSTLVGAADHLLPVPSSGWGSSGVVVGDRGICAWTLLDLQHFGPPQRRVRLFLLTAHAVGDTGAVVCDPAEVLSLASRVRGDSPQGREAGERVADSLTVGANQTCGFAGDDVACGGNEQGRVALSFGWQNSAEQGDDVRSEASASLRTNTVPGVLAFDTTQVTSVANRSNPRAGAPCHPLAAGAHAPLLVASVTGDVAHALTAEGHDASEDGTGRGTPIVANTVCAREAKGWAPENAIGNGTVTDGIPRRLTPLECVRLMGWPDEHLDIAPPLSDSAKYRMCGNGVGAPVAEWIGWRLASALTPSSPLSRAGARTT